MKNESIEAMILARLKEIYPDLSPEQLKVVSQKGEQTLWRSLHGVGSISVNDYVQKAADLGAALVAQYK